MGRAKSITFWSVAFPLVLATLFYMAFADIDKAGLARPVSIVVVDDAAYRAAPGLAETIEASHTGEDPWLDVEYVQTETAAEQLVGDGGYYGYVKAESSGQLEYHRDWRDYTGYDPGHEIATALLDSYLRNAAFAASHPGAAMQQPANFTKSVQLTAQAPSDQVRYFYSVLGFAVVMGCNFAMFGVSGLRSGRSQIGARVALGGVARYRVLAPTVAAAYILTLVTLIIGFLYIRFVLQIAFGGRDWEILAILAVGAMATTALGAALATVPLPAAALAGLSAAIACLLSLFAGLYGPGSQLLADQVAQSAPWFTWFNPAREIYDALFSLYCYDTFDQAAVAMGKLALLALALFAVAAWAMRRVRHAHL
jgi:ABC-2 type transport system permease protein